MAAAATFRLVVTAATADEIAAAQHESDHDSGSQASSSADAVPDGHVRCGVCQATFPKDRLVMHERHCAKRMGKCGTCGKAMLSTDLQAHELVAHTQLRCRCGRQLAQRELHAHQMNECAERLFKCPSAWCQLVIAFKDFEQHEVACTMRPTSCVVCAQEVRAGGLLHRWRRTVFLIGLARAWLLCRSSDTGTLRHTWLWRTMWTRQQSTGQSRYTPRACLILLVHQSRRHTLQSVFFLGGDFWH